jgi:aspartyl-tRNA(Asn)/glutamyl-tRNA(Gln) amidotransferase subunit A
MIDAWSSAAAVAAAVAAREVSVSEVVDAALARLAAVEPRINAFAERMDDAAREAARAAGQAVMQGAPLGPLHGVPLTVKDNVPMAGHRLGNGSRAGLEVTAGADAAVVTRLRAAGAIVIGRTTLPEFAHRVMTDSPTWGVTRNPWNLAHTPGGSSGGASASLAAGVTPLAVGTDGGGSLRFPASCTGTIALKPTLGTVPNDTAPDGFGNYAFVGPMARHAADAALMLSVMAGPLTADPYSHGRAAPAGAVAPEGAARGLRIGWIEHVGPYRTAPEVSGPCTAALRALEGEGAVVAPLAAPCLDAVYETYQVIATAAHAARLGPVVERWGEAITPAFRDSVAIGARWSAVELVRAQDRRTALYRAVQALFAGCDLMATPTTTVPPPTVETNGAIASDWYAAAAGALYPFNLTGNPASSVPAGFTAEGLPIGLQLVAPWYAEQRILDVAALLEARLGLAARRPPL